MLGNVYNFGSKEQKYLDVTRTYRQDEGNRASVKRLLQVYILVGESDAAANFRSLLAI